MSMRVAVLGAGSRGVASAIIDFGIKSYNSGAIERRNQ